MNDSKQQIAIAQACGWTEIEECTCHNRQFKGFEPNPGQHKKHTPDYINDLNAMYEAEKRLGDGTHLWDRYCDFLGGSLYHCAHATAAKRAEAFLKTLNLWKP